MTLILLSFILVVSGALEKNKYSKEESRKKRKKSWQRERTSCTKYSLPTPSGARRCFFTTRHADAATPKAATDIE